MTSERKSKDCGEELDGHWLVGYQGVMGLAHPFDSGRAAVETGYCCR